MFYAWGKFRSNINKEVIKWIKYFICLSNFLIIISFKSTLLTSGFASSNNYIILDGIEGCMRIYCTRHDDIHRAGTARWIPSWQMQYIII